MTLQRIPPLSLSLLLVLAACSAGESDATPEGSEAPEAPAAEATVAADEQALDALREEWVTHFNLHHPDMVADLYTADAVALLADQGVYEGRDAIAAWLAESAAGEPTVSVADRGSMIFGDAALIHGTYETQATSPEGEPLTATGGYMNVLQRVDGEWRIAGMVTNYDSPRPEGWPWAEGEGEPPAEEGTMAELVEAFETHWNLGHADMVADLFTEDAVVSFSDSPFIEGRAAVQASLEESMAEEPATTLTVHDVGTMDLDADHRVDGGWYELTAGEGGEVVQSGAYMLLARRDAEGSWKLQRFISNGRPVASP